jgi:CRP/FNR family transcriptional regulator, anaerobic regulatory protein
MLSTIGAAAQNGFLKSQAIRAISSRTRRVSGALGPEELGLFASARSNVRSFAAGQSMIRQGEPCTEVYVLLGGWAICQKMLEDGGRQILDLVLPGHIFGFNVLGGASYGVEAKTDCTAVVLSREAFNALLLRAPNVCLKCAEVFASAELRAFERLSQVGRLNARQRVGGLIVELAVRLRDLNEGAASRLALPLTQLDIADMLGLAHETVCRVLVAMRNMKLTTWRNGRLEIHDLERLMEFSGIDPETVDLDPCDLEEPCRRLAQAA